MRISDFSADSKAIPDRINGSPRGKTVADSTSVDSEFHELMEKSITCLPEPRRDDRIGWDVMLASG